MTEALTRLHIRSAIRRLHGRPAVRIVASDLPLYDRTSRERRVLFATDDFLAGAELMGLKKRQIEQHEKRLAREVELVVAVSEVIADRWRAAGCEVVVVPNGCDAERFAGTDDAPWPEDVRLPGPIAGFAGQINERIDISLLEAVASSGLSLLLVGPITRTFDPRRLDVLLDRPNVQWVGPKSFDTMPSYLKAIHVGLTPYADTPFNRASNPLKTIEYLAAGRAVVATSLPSARHLGTEHVTLADGPRAFAEAVKARLDQTLSGPLVTMRRAVASGHSWEARAKQFAEAIGIDLSNSPGLSLA